MAMELSGVKHPLGAMGPMCVFLGMLIVEFGLYLFMLIYAIGKFRNASSTASKLLLSAFMIPGVLVFPQFLILIVPMPIAIIATLAFGAHMLPELW